MAGMQLQNVPAQNINVIKRFLINKYNFNLRVYITYFYAGIPIKEPQDNGRTTGTTNRRSYEERKKILRRTQIR